MKVQDRVRFISIIAIFLLALFSIYKADMINSVFIRSVYRVIYIPLLFWAIVLLYSIAAHLTFFGAVKGIAETLKKGAALGFLANLYIALFDLVITLTRHHSFLSEYYFGYIKTILLVFTCGISFGAVFLIRRLKIMNLPEESYRVLFFYPLFILPLYFMINFAVMLPRNLFAAALPVFYLLPYVLKGRLPSVVTDKARHVFGFMKKDVNLLIFIFILAFLLRALFAVNIINKTEAEGAKGFVQASDDGISYDRTAVELAQDTGKGAKREIKIWGGNWDEAYAVFLAGLYRLFGRNFYVVTLIQAFFGAFIPVIVFLLGKLLFSRTEGIVAAIAMTLKSPIIFLSIVLGHEAVWFPLFMLFVLALSRYYKAKRRNYVNEISAGVAIGLVCVFRSIFLYFLPFMFLWILFFWKDKPVSDRIKAFLAVVIPAIAIMAAVLIIFNNNFNFGAKERLASLWESDRLYGSTRIGNSRFTDMGVHFIKDMPGSVRAIGKEPLRFFGVLLKYYPLRIAAYLQAYQFGFFDPVYLINYAKYPNGFMPTLEFYFTLFFIYGLIRCLRQDRILKSPIFMVLVFHITIFALVFFVITPRYRDICTPFIYLIGAHGFIDALCKLGIFKKTLKMVPLS